MTLAVALSDLGEFAAAHPQGRAVVTSLGLRAVVMSFLANKERAQDDVKTQALLAYAKLIAAPAAEKV